MRVQLEEPNAADELIDYLDRCNCRARRVGEDIVDVRPGQNHDVDAALRLTKAGRCYSCAEPVERALAELGSPLCHDCRSVAGRRSRERSGALLELQAYLQVWNALHPSAATIVLE